MKRWMVGAALCLLAASAQADVSITDSDTLARAVHAKSSVGHQVKAGDKSPIRMSQVSHPLATGSIALIDSSGMKYFINTNITFSTSSSASGAMSEASYTHAVAATTSGGGTTSSTLNDAFDGYNTICLSFPGTAGTCETGNANFIIYNKNGPATVDTSVPATAQCTGRQIVFPTQSTPYGLDVYRKVFVPTDDSYARTLNVITNTSAAAVTTRMTVANNLGSDSNTVIVNSSSGDAAGTTADYWVTTFQNYSGSTSSDPRLGHVLWGPNAPVPLADASFNDGDDNPYWSYDLTLQPGETRIIMTFVTAQPSKAAAATQAARLATLPASALECLSSTEQAQVANFISDADLSITLNPPAGQIVTNSPVTFTGTIANAGPNDASNAVATITLPAGYTANTATAPGFSCGVAANVVTCTAATFANGASSNFSIDATTPATASADVATATVSADNNDPNPANNSATITVGVQAPVGPAVAVPGLRGFGLLLLVLGLAAAPYLRRRALR